MGVCRFQATQNLLKPLKTPFDDTPVASVANKQTHTKPFKRLLPVGWGFG